MTLHYALPSIFWQRFPAVTRERTLVILEFAEANFATLGSRGKTDRQLHRQGEAQPSHFRIRPVRKICPMIETVPLEQAADGYARMMQGKARFRMGADCEGGRR